MEDRGEDSLLAKKAKKKRNVGKSCVAYGCKQRSCTATINMCPAITDDFSYQPITGDVSFHATKMFYHSSCFVLFPWLPRRHWAAQPMKLRLVIYRRSLAKLRLVRFIKIVLEKTFDSFILKIDENSGSTLRFSYLPSKERFL